MMKVSFRSFVLTAVVGDENLMGGVRQAKQLPRPH